MPPDKRAIPPDIGKICIRQPLYLLFTFHIATFKGYASIVQCLLASDHVDSGELLSCDVHGIHNFQSETASSVVCRRSSVEIVKLLFHHSVDVNTVCANGISPLEHALSKSRECVVMFLLADTLGRVAYNIEDVFNWEIYCHSYRVARFCNAFAAMDGKRTRSWCRLVQGHWLRHQIYLLHLCE